MNGEKAPAPAGRWLRTALIVGMGLTLPSAATRCEDLKGRWSIGAGGFYFSTLDSIRSNATTVLGPAGDDGVPFTADPNEDLNCANASTYCDPRPDDQLARAIRIGDSVQYNLNVSYGAASWLSLRLDAGYSRSNIGPVGYFLSDHFPVEGEPSNPSLPFFFKDRAFTKTLRAGELTEVPVSLSGIMRFRVKKRINPYFVIGAGKLFTNLERSADLDAMHDRLKHQRIRSVTNESLNNLVPIGLLDLYANETRIPFIWKMRPSTSNATEWHLAAGIEYFFNERLSVAFEGRSMYTGANVDLEFDGEDQLNLMTWSEKILREDGSVRIFAPGPTAPNPFCYQVDWHGLGCNPQTHDYASRVDPEGLDVWGTQHYTCPAQGDFDMDGRPDVCYGRNVAPSPLGYTEPRGDIIVQGGKIRLPGVSAGVSLRFHF